MVVCVDSAAGAAVGVARRSRLFRFGLLDRGGCVARGGRGGRLSRLHAGRIGRRGVRWNRVGSILRRRWSPPRPRRPCLRRLVLRITLPVADLPSSDAGLVPASEPLAAERYAAAQRPDRTTKSRRTRRRGTRGIGTFAMPVTLQPSAPMPKAAARHPADKAGIRPDLRILCAHWYPSQIRWRLGSVATYRASSF